MAVIGLVEDEEVLRRSLARTLEYQGHAVRAAETAEQGLEMVQAAPPDVLITDYRLPGMSGHDLLVQVKREFPEVVVIMITAHGTSDDAREALREGAAAYLNKPLDLQELGVAVQRCLSGQEDAGESDLS